MVTGTIVVNAGAAWTGSVNATLDLTASSTGGAVTQMRFTNDGVTFSTPEPFAATRSWALAAGSDGPRTVGVEFIDVTGGTVLAVDDLGLDTTGPALPALSINGGATTTRNLTLSMATTPTDGTGSGVSTVQFSSDQVTWSTPQAWAATMNFTPGAGDGTRTFYARAIDLVGNTTPAPWAFASIVIDQTPPSGMVDINAGAAFTNVPDVSLAITASDLGSGLARMCLKSGATPITFTTPAPTDSCWVTVSATQSHTLTPATNGNQRVFAWFEDVAGNISPSAATDDIVLDTVPPAAGTVSVNGNVTATSSLAVGLSILDTDLTSGVARMCIKSGTMPITFTAPLANDSCWVSYATSQPVTLASTAEGNHRVVVWFQDAAGNINLTPATDDILLDTRAPSAPANLVLVSVASRTITVSMTLGTDPAPAAPPLAVQVGFRLNGSTGPFTFAPTSTTGTPGQVRLNLSLGNTYELVARMIDGAGNVSPNTANTVVAATAWVWTHLFHTPWADPFQPEASAVLNGTSFIMTSSLGAGEAWLDNGDGFQTMRRLDASGYAIAVVPSTTRALVGTTYTDDLGVTFWQPSFGASGTWYGATWVKSTPSGSATRDTFVLVGSGGNILRGDVTSTPGLAPSGAFVPVTSGTTQTLNAVATCLGCTDVVVAVGTGMRRSIDGGLTWTAVALSAALTGNYDSIVAVPGTQIMYAGSSGSIGLVRSLDGGASWAQVAGVPTGVRALSVSGTGASYTLWVATGFTNSPAITRYDGTTATAVPLIALPTPRYGPTTIAGMGVGPTAQAVYGGYSGELVHLSQNGATVVRRMKQSPLSLRSISFADGSAQNVLLVGGSTTAYLSSDQGQSWTPEVMPGTPVSAYYFADGSAVAVGGTLILARSAAGVWTSIPSGGTQALTHVSCRGLAGCLISGNANTALGYDPVTRVVTPLLSGPGNAYLGSYTWVDSSAVVHGVLVGANGAVRTCTGCLTGSTFLPEILLPPPVGTTTLPTLNAVAARSTGRVIAVGDPGSFSVAYASSDSGLTWTRIGTLPGFDTQAVISAQDSATWYAAGWFGAGVSTNDGATWQAITPTTWTDAFSIATPTVGPLVPATLLMAGNYGAVWRSTTGGL